MDFTNVKIFLLKVWLEHALTQLIAVVQNEHKNVWIVTHYQNSGMVFSTLQPKLEIMIKIVVSAGTRKL
tara:strand:- start:360 stop:566 length:207 start_codon:yes stop_codon:yes gene_type:complete